METHFRKFSEKNAFPKKAKEKFITEEKF